MYKKIPILYSDELFAYNKNITCKNKIINQKINLYTYNSMILANKNKTTTK